MRPNAENPRQLPLKDQILQWLDTQEASSVHEAIRSLILFQHRGDHLSLNYFFNLPQEVTLLSKTRQISWLTEHLSIEDMRHATFAIEKNRLLLSSRADGWKHPLIAMSLVHKEQKLGVGDNVATGVTAKIKSTGQNIFIPDHTTAGLAGLAMGIYGAKEFYERVSKRPGYVPLLIKSIEGLEKKGYTILVPEFDTTGDIKKSGKFTLLTNK